jgi:hypothetical protein
LVVGCIGIAGFITPHLLLLFPQLRSSVPRTVELPNADPTSLAVDQHGALYVTSTALGRIQKYSPDGRFEHGWFVESRGGVFGIAVQPAGLIEVCAQRRKQLALFDTDGRSVPSPSPMSCDPQAPRFHVTQVGGFRIEKHATVPTIEVLSADGARRFTIWPPPLLPLWSPVIAWIMAALWIAPNALHELPRVVANLKAGRFV